MRPDPLPPIGEADLQALKKHFEDGLYLHDTLYARDRGTWRLAELYDQGIQTWLDPARSPFDGGSTSSWSPMHWTDDDPQAIPTPVFNEGFGVRTNESARLGRPAYRPKVTPKENLPSYEIKLGSKRATDVLRGRLAAMNWYDKESPLLYYSMPVYGGAYLRSEWVQSWDKTTRAPVTTAYHCPRNQVAPMEGQPKPPGQCDFVLSDTNIPQKFGGGWVGSPVAPPSTKGPGFKARNCPTCPDHPPLMPFKPNAKETHEGKDTLGRSLGRDQPLGDWFLRVASPFETFVKDMGHGMSQGNISEWREIHSESMDWVALRFPEKAGEVEPERVDEAVKFNPILGSPDVWGSMVNSKILKDRVNIRAWYKMPWPEPQESESEEGKTEYRMNKGRCYVYGNNTLLFDGPMMMESLNQPGQFVERVYLDYIPWELRDGARRLQGMGLWELLFDPQDAANEIRAQVQAVRQRMALPAYMGKKSWNLELAMRDGIPGSFWMIDTDPDEAVPNLQTVNNMTIDAGVNTEREDASNSMSKLGNEADVETGNPPTGVSAALAFQYLKTFASERREPRIARIKLGLVKAWQHGLKLCSAFYIEPREVKTEDEYGNDVWASIHGADLFGQTNVTVEAEAEFEDKIKNQQLVMEFADKGWLGDIANDPKTRRAVAEFVDFPEGLFESQDIQKESAQREWLWFKDKGRTPVVDPTLDDHGEHYDQHGIDAQSDWFLHQEELADWDSIIKVLSGTWDQTVQNVITEGIKVQQAMMQQQMMLQIQAQATGAPPPPMQIMPLPCIQDRLMKAWGNQLAMATQARLYKPTKEIDQEALKKVLYWRAHMEEHRVTEQARQLAAQVQPVLAAPGGEATPEGTQPTEGAPPEEMGAPEQGVPAGVQ